VRIAVCAPQVPFARGGAEILADALVHELHTRGHTAEVVSVPYKWYPGTRALTAALLWRLVDLTEVDGEPIDLVIPMKFPAYAVRHPRKVVWLIHQFRQAYEYDGTELGQFGDEPQDRAAVRAIYDLDRKMLSEARKVFATTRNVADRLARSTGIDAELLPHPPPQLAYRCDEYGDFVLSVGRLDPTKRVDLLLQAAAEQPALRFVVAGDGPERGRLEALAHSLGLDGRVTFAGRVGDEELTDLYARCLGVFYAPADEDSGLVPYEAFLSTKPVITTSDAGGPLEIVADHRTGLVCEPTSAALAEAFAWLSENREGARELGRSGKEVAARVTWDATIDRLLAP
jgi:glycosyltransferase involved in cell wall biosynthesis